MEKHIHLLQKCVILIISNLKHIKDGLRYIIGVLKRHLLLQSKEMVDNIVMTIMEDGLNLNRLCVNIGVLIERHISIDVLKD